MGDFAEVSVTSIPEVGLRIDQVSGLVDLRPREERRDLGRLLEGHDVLLVSG